MIYLYFNGPSNNHGCEAISRSSSDILGSDIVIASNYISIDRDYGLNKVASLYDDKYIELKRGSVKWFIAAVIQKLFKSEYLFTKYSRETLFRRINPCDTFCSAGGDQYCYTGTEYLYHYNKAIHQKGAKTVLWGCSIEPSTVTDANKKDFRLYDLIVARESISYDFLKRINPNTILACDPAFNLKTDELKLPNNFIEGRTVGINISPLIQNREKIDGITIDNYENMINHILENTDYNIALIPHVVCDGNDDRVSISELYQKINNKERICIIEDCNCEQLKGCISRCCLFIGARTHATIAAYSTFVPTLVIGYSTKARGIARDLFGDEEHYLLPVQSLETPDQMTNAFIWLDEHREDIKERLEQIIPEYSKTIYRAAERVRELNNKC